MAETLVQIIRSIENLSQYVEVNKAELIKSAWKEWEDKNKVVSDRSEDKTTFLIEYETAYGKYDNYRAMSPYSVPKGYVEKHAPLNECIGSPFLSEGIGGYVTNPLGMGVTTVAGMAALIRVMGPLFMKSLANPEKIDRRTFLKIDKTWLIGGGVVGGLVGAELALVADDRLKKIKENAIYLDNICDTYIRVR